MAHGQSKPALRMFIPFLILILPALSSAPAARAAAQNTTDGTLEFFGAGEVERSSGVWIDGQYAGYLGELKGKKTVSLSPGEHQISVRQAGYKDFNIKVTVESGKATGVEVAMTAAAGETYPMSTAELKIDVKPSRAAVFVDGRFLGHAGELGGRFHSAVLGTGKHQIRVELPGYQTFETEVNLTEGQKSVVKTELVKGTSGPANPPTDQTTDSGHSK